jgi:hypothetical protein
MTCALASKITGKPQPAGKELTFVSKNDEPEIKVIVENHKASTTDILFHLSTEQCNSTHRHKIGLEE